MGFFDESESDDEPPTQSQQTNQDEEDPLDAYMKSLQAESTEEPSRNSQTLLRLDLEQEEANESDHQLDTAEKPASKPDSKRTKDAKSVLESVFTKGAGPVKPIAEPAASSEFQKVYWSRRNTMSGKNWRKQHEIILHDRDMGTVDPVLTFQETQGVLGEPLSKYLSETFQRGPTLVQAQTLPMAWLGRDAVVTAPTGQGKTLAYVLGLIPQVVSQKLKKSDTGPIALILVPTRELAQQVHKQIQKLEALTTPRSIKSRAVIGGVGKYVLYTELKRSNVDIVVATPGRLLDVVADKKGLSLSRVTFVVLDEADKMLFMGFEKQVRSILSSIQRNRQTLLLSATMSKKIEQVASEWLQNNSVRISIGKTGEASHNVTQHVMVLPDEESKQAFLVAMLPTFRDIGKSIVFVSTKDGCEKLALLLQQQTNVTIRTLHGDKHQAERTAAVKAFTKHQVSVLVATDVAARGLDIPNVQTVISFDPAKDLDGHVHRVGRAGRLSQNQQQCGSAYTLLTPRNADFAFVLKNAFEREGWDISDELDNLARTSKKSGNVEYRTQSNKGGLGYVNPFDDAPPAKRSRWS